MASNILDTILSALPQAANQPSIVKYSSLPEAQFIERVTELCHDAESCGCGSAEFWSLLAKEMTSTHKELVFIGNQIQLNSCSMHGNLNHHLELELLSRLCRGSIHLGIILTHLLLPSSIDPVIMASTKQRCYHLMVSEFL